MLKPKTVSIDNVEYVRKEDVKKQVKSKDGLTLCIVRTYSAGVWMGWVDYENAPLTNSEVLDAVRIYKWEGAFTLSNLAVNGTSKPSGCRFANKLDKMKLNNCIEYLPVYEKALKELEKVEKE